MEQLIVEREVPADPGSTALDELLRARPRALVAALGPDGRLSSVPASIRLGAHQAFERTTGIDLAVASDQPAIAAGWARAQTEPVVHLEVHLRADPERAIDLFYVDARADHGVHVIIFDAPDPALVLDTIASVDSRRRIVGHVQRDAVGTFLSADLATTALLGWSPEEVVGRRSIDLIHPDDVDRAIEGWMAMRAGTGNGRIQVRFRHATGRYVWLEVTNDDHLDDPALGCVESELVDISQEMEELEALHDRERHLQRLADALPIGVCHLRAGRQVAYANPPFVDLFGPVDSLDSLVAVVVAADRPAAVEAFRSALLGRSVGLEVGLATGAGTRRCDLTFRPIDDDHGRRDGVIMGAADVTDRTRMRDELEHRASHDELSGCLNRAAALAALDEVLQAGAQVTVAYLDLDCLKVTNDELGHPVGDQLLRTVADRLRMVTRPEDRLGRMGGDEFVVICPHGGRPLDATALVQRIAAAVCGEVDIAGHVVDLQASIGAAASRAGERDAEVVLGRADAAMYEAKRRRRTTEDRS